MTSPRSPQEDAQELFDRIAIPGDERFEPLPESELNQALEQGGRDRAAAEAMLDRSEISSGVRFLG